MVHTYRSKGIIAIFFDLSMAKDSDLEDVIHGFDLRQTNGSLSLLTIPITLREYLHGLDQVILHSKELFILDYCCYHHVNCFEFLLSLGKFLELTWNCSKVTERAVEEPGKSG